MQVDRTVAEEGTCCLKPVSAWPTSVPFHTLGAILFHSQAVVSGRDLTSTEERYKYLYCAQHRRSHGQYNALGRPSVPHASHPEVSMDTCVHPGQPVRIPTTSLLLTAPDRRLLLIVNPIILSYKATVYPTAYYLLG